MEKIRLEPTIPSLTSNTLANEAVLQNYCFNSLKTKTDKAL